MPPEFRPVDRSEQGGGDRRALLAAAVDRLRRAGIEDAARDAQWLLAAALGQDSPARMGREGRLDAATARHFQAMVVRRMAHEPVSRILGRRGFWTLDLVVTPAVLDPRPDSETLVAGVLERVRGRAIADIVDLGTGSGCLLLALLMEIPAARGFGVDLSGEALAVARHNARAAGLSARAAFLRGDWTSALRMHSADLVIANPPYIATDDLAGLMPEVRDHDPHLALDGGPQGLDAYRRIVPELPRLLRPGGTGALEVDDLTAMPVLELAIASGAREARILRDLADRKRVLLADW